MTEEHRYFALTLLNSLSLKPGSFFPPSSWPVEVLSSLRCQSGSYHKESGLLALRLFEFWKGKSRPGLAWRRTQPLLPESLLQQKLESSGWLEHPTSHPEKPQ